MPFPSLDALWIYVPYYLSMLISFEYMIPASPNKTIGLRSDCSHTIAIATARHDQVGQVLFRHSAIQYHDRGVFGSGVWIGASLRPRGAVYQR